MKYVGVIYKDVIIAKAKIYKDIIAENQIELTEEQYNTIVTPCQLVDGVFVPCDFPEIDKENDDVPKVGMLTEIITYVGNGKSGADNPCSITCSFAPKIVQMMGFVHDSGEQFSTHASEELDIIYDVIFCDKLNTEYTGNAGFKTDALNTTKRYAKKSADGKTISWYVDNTSTNGKAYQYNISGTTYYVLAMG